MLLTQTVYANSGGISLSQTRVIFNEGKKSVPLTVKNTSEINYLIQSRVLTSLKETISSDFIITPPLFTLKSESQQALRIIADNLNLPTKQESLFYISVIGIPAQKKEEQDVTKLSMGIAFSIKLFYRPLGLTAPNEKIYCSLLFNKKNNETEIVNPTPYYLTIGELKMNNQKIDLSYDESMISPFGHLKIPEDFLGKTAGWKIITDAGGLSPECHHRIWGVWTWN
nr:molecular chaperone [Providencia rettgeri]